MKCKTCKAELRDFCICDTRCINGIDYDECDNERSKNSEYCSECNEKAYDKYIDSLEL